MSGPALAARALTKRYGATPAVDSLDLTVDRGTLYGFLGPNGSGKTTTIRMALGLVAPTAGAVEVLGRPVVGGGAGRHEALRRTGALVEEPGFWRYLSGRKNLECFARVAGPAEDRRARLSRIDETLALVGLESAAGKRVKAYSQGMRQRLGIALALLGRPELLMLDEPTNGLDPQGMREIRQLLRRLADDGTTVFVSSHLLWEVEGMCDRVGVLHHGRLVADAPPSELRSAGDRLRVEVDDPSRAIAVLGDLEGVEVLDESRVSGSAGDLRLRLRAPATAAGVNASLVSAGVAVSALGPDRASLEDVFLSLTEEAGDVPG